MIVTFDHHQYFPMKFYAGDRAGPYGDARPGAGT